MKTYVMLNGTASHRRLHAIGEQLRVQDFRCAICGIDGGDLIDRKLYVDHDHATGALRGMLCASCNLAMSALDKGDEWLRAATRYKHDPPWK